MMGAPSLLPCPAFTRKRTVSPHIGVLPLVWGTVRCRSAHLGEITITNSPSLFSRFFVILPLRVHAALGGTVRNWGCWVFFQDCYLTWFDAAVDRGLTHRLNWSVSSCCESIERLKESLLRNGWYRVNLQVLENPKNCYAGKIDWKYSQEGFSLTSSGTYASHVQLGSRQITAICSRL